jgi:GNAT superfamily N-acetyltransferase
LDFLKNNCTLYPFSETLIRNCSEFDCAHDDLNEFFKDDCVNYSNELLGKTYCFLLDNDLTKVVCAFTVSNDSIKTNLLAKSKKNKISRPIPNIKRTISYPAVLIGRLGVSKDFKRQGIGTELMNFIKGWFIDEKNKTGCRFVVVDSYNEPIPLEYYQNNGFQFLFQNEQEEKENTGKENITESLKTRLMYFDLIKLKG